MENNLKQLPERFSVYAKTLEEAKYISEKQKELCGYNYPQRNVYYRFSPKEPDKSGYSSGSYLTKSYPLCQYNIQHEFTFEEFKSFFEKKEEFPTDDFCISNNGNNVEVVEYLKSKGFNTVLDGSNTIAYYGIKFGKVDISYSLNFFKTSYTLKQLKELDNMKERKIIGYKLLEKIEGYKTEVGSICKDPLYFALYKDHPKFEAVYEQKYKVGDWITVTNTSNSKWLLDTNQKTFKLTQEPTKFNNVMCWSTSGIGDRGMNNVGMYGICEEDFRKATEEEIKSVQQKTINVNNTDIIIKKGSMFAVDAEFKLEYLQEISKDLFNEKITSRWTVNVESVKIGCKTGWTKAHIDIIIDEYKKFNTN